MREYETVIACRVNIRYFPFTHIKKWECSIAVLHIYEEAVPLRVDILSDGKLKYLKINMMTI